MLPAPPSNVSTSPYRWMWGGWLVTLAVVLVVWLQPPLPSDAPGVRWLKHERLWMHDVTGTAHTKGPQEVTLPDSWKPQGMPAAGTGRYRSQLQVSEAVARATEQEPWSIRIDHLSYVHRVWINGDLLHSTLPRPGWLGMPAPTLIDLPGCLLRPGVNVVEVEVHSAQQGGLSTPVLAPKAQLYPDFVRHRVLTRDALITLNILWIAFSAFVVALWWLRRQEAAAGLFGLLVLVGALRNCRYFITEDLGLSVGVESWLYFTAHVLTASLQGWFVMALVERHLRLFSRVMWAVLILFPLVAALALPFDPDLRITRGYLQGALILSLVPSLWLVLSWGMRTDLHSPMKLGLAAGWAAVLVAGVHDFIFGRVIGLVTVQHWMSWMIPLATPSFLLMVVIRVVRAFDDIEQANQQLESKVAERTRELAAANAAKSHFLASASHDLRQPVAAIGLITDLLQSRLTDPALRGLTDRLTRAVHSMESLLKGLLDLSRLDSGTVEVQRQRVRLQPLLDAVASHESEAARHKGLSLRVRRTDAVVWTDPVLLEQILRNLVGNAIRHTQRGGVLVGVRQRGPRWLIQVWDTGPGIAGHNLPRIFEAFVQLSNPARDREKGLGLGLAIAQRAATLLAHTLSAQSRVDRGSCFSVSVPGAQGAQDIPAEEPCASSARTLQGRQVLLIEDDTSLRETLITVLQGWGLHVTAGPGLRWLGEQPARHWDLLITDHRLGDGSGREAVQMLRQRQPELPAIVITGDTSPRQLTALASSGLPVLHKPFRAEKLRAMVEETMARPDRDDSV